MSAMKRLFQLMAEKKASDIFLSVSSPINIKINGVAVPVNQQVMNADTIVKLLYEVLTPKQIKEYEDTLELNTAFTLEPYGTFRISGFRQKGTPAVVVRFMAHARAAAAPSGRASNDTRRRPRRPQAGSRSDARRRCR